MHKTAIITTNKQKIIEQVNNISNEKFRKTRNPTTVYPLKLTIRNTSRYSSGTVVLNNNNNNNRNDRNVVTVTIDR